MIFGLDKQLGVQPGKIDDDLAFSIPELLRPKTKPVSVHSSLSSARTSAENDLRSALTEPGASIIIVEKDGKFFNSPVIPWHMKSDDRKAQIAEMIGVIGGGQVAGTVSKSGDHTFTFKGP